WKGERPAPGLPAVARSRPSISGPRGVPGLLTRRAPREPRPGRYVYCSDISLTALVRYVQSDKRDGSRAANRKARPPIKRKGHLLRIGSIARAKMNDPPAIKIN